MDKYRIGQKVRIIRVVEGNESLLNKVVEITAQRRKFSNIIYGDWLGYSVSCRGNFEGFEYNPPEDWLEPVYDGDEKSSWSEFSWRPKEKIVG
jgi:hypothetical protein